jgi:DNA polymerase V
VDVLPYSSEPKSDDRVMKVMDNINQKYGTDTALLASQGTDEKWAMRRQFLTPQYTTTWHDIPKIHC